MLKMTDIKVGDVLIADDAFPCIAENRQCEVLAEGDGTLYVLCRGPDGDDANYVHHHGLDGQEDEEGTCVGFVKLDKH